MLDGSRATLAPRYDLGTHAPYPSPEGQTLKLAMFVDGEYAMDRVGRPKLGLDEDHARFRAREILHGIAPAFNPAAAEATRILGDDGPI